MQKEQEQTTALREPDEIPQALSGKLSVAALQPGQPPRPTRRRHRRLFRRRRR